MNGYNEYINSHPEANVNQAMQGFIDYIQSNEAMSFIQEKSRNMHKMALVTEKCHKSCEIYLKNIKNNLVIQS